MSSDNGHTIHVNGLPEGYGDELHVKFASGEAILKSSNQTKTISQEAIQEIYNLFRTTAIKSSYDFTTDKSTRPIYDDADEQFLQGTYGPDGISVKTARLYLPAVMSSSTTTISLPMIPAM